MSKQLKQLKLFQNADIKSVTLSDDLSVATIEGYASVFRNDDFSINVDRDGEVVNTNGLDLTNYLKSPVVVYDHDWSKIIGKATNVMIDSKGLWVKCEIHRLTNYEHIFEAVVKGLLSSFSIGFVPKDYKWYSDETLEISEAELLEISIVSVPSNANSIFNVIGTKSVGVSMKELKEQNGLSCDDMGCFLKTIKGEDNMLNGKTKEVTPAAEPGVTPAVEPKVEPAVTPVTPVAEPKVEPAIVQPTTQVVEAKVDLASLAQSIFDAQVKADELKAAKEAEDKAKAEADALAKIEADKAKIVDTLNYLKEQAEIITNTAATDIDIDTYETLYETASSVVEALDVKVAEVVKQLQEAQPAA